MNCRCGHPECQDCRAKACGVTDELEGIVERLRELIADMEDDARLQVLLSVQEGYCRYCGSNDPLCQCWNDE